VSQEINDPHPALAADVAEFESLLVAAEKPREAVLVQDIEIAELGHMVPE
jgi:hypothetical protein